MAKSTPTTLLDKRVNAFSDYPLTGEWPYLWLDATYLKQREGGRIVSVAAIIAVAANTDGKREIVGLHIGPSEAETFWATRVSKAWFGAVCTVRRMHRLENKTVDLPSRFVDESSTSLFTWALNADLKNDFVK